MTQDARIRIDAHPLLRREADAVVSTDVESPRGRTGRGSTARHIIIHVAIFSCAFIFTAGAALLGILLWVRPDGLFALVSVGIGSSVVFVGAFAGLRILAIHYLRDAAADDEDVPTLEYHIAQSVIYALVALVGALLLAGVLINSASAGGESLSIRVPEPTS